MTERSRVIPLIREERLDAPIVQTLIRDLNAKPSSANHFRLECGLLTARRVNRQPPLTSVPLQSCP
jgi:hypothetical protein